MTKGRPSNWTDNDLIEMLLDVKSKNPDTKLTKVMLEKETGIGRNTWSRRMDDNIQKLNIQNSSLSDSKINSNALFPSIEMTLKSSMDNPAKLVDEILKLENIILHQHIKMEETEDYKTKFEKIYVENQSLRDENNTLKLKYKFYESAYLSILASSSYTFLQDVDGSIIKEHGIKESLINMRKNLNDNLSLNQLNDIFKSIEKESFYTKKKEENFNKLVKDFDL